MHERKSACCAGHLPFEGKDRPDLKRNILANKIKPMPAALSQTCRDFIASMMSPHPDERPSAAVLLTHPFVTFYTGSVPATQPPAAAAEVAEGELSPPVPAALVSVPRCPASACPAVQHSLAGAPPASCTSLVC